MVEVALCISFSRQWKQQRQHVTGSTLCSLVEFIQLQAYTYRQFWLSIKQGPMQNTDPPRRSGAAFLKLNTVRKLSPAHNHPLPKFLFFFYTLIVITLFQAARKLHKSKLRDNFWLWTEQRNYSLQVSLRSTRALLRLTEQRLQTTILLSTFTVKTAISSEKKKQNKHS